MSGPRHDALPDDPLSRPAYAPPPRLAARYQPHRLIAIEPTALRSRLFFDRRTALVARRAVMALPEPARSHLQNALQPEPPLASPSPFGDPALTLPPPSGEPPLTFPPPSGEPRLTFPPRSGEPPFTFPPPCGEGEGGGRFSAPASWKDLAACLAWDLLYWNEPDLYDRLTEGEPLHPGLIAELPLDDATVLDVGAGAGRLTLICAARASRVYALEPATPLRDILSHKLEVRGITNVVPLGGWCGSIPLPAGRVDLVVSASAFGADPARGGDEGLKELLRVTRPGGGIFILWPDDPRWFLSRGFFYHAFGGPMEVRFRDLETAEACAAIFYPPRVLEHLRQTRRPVVPFDLIGVNAPRDLCARTLPGGSAA